MNLYTLKKDNHKYKSKAQFNEDLYLLQIFKDKVDGVIVDVGANDGQYGSNSALLESLGWKSVLVEPNTSLCHQILAYRRPYKLFQFAASSKETEMVLYQVDGGALAHGLSTLELNTENKQRIEENNFFYNPTSVRTRTLDSMLIEAGLSQIDVISIDVEGHELEVLKGLSFEKWHPRILIIEDNSLFKSGDVSSFMKTKNYSRFFRTGVNDWYAADDDNDLVNKTNSLFYMAGKYFSLAKFQLSKLYSVKRFIRKFLKK
ncbi:MAG: FkbM family methyltransferase [Methylotenera sp.]|nr:FkbM family methyltransferase [Methylotenera sp.]MDP3060375.1 FkbM family methyltransferase [Methylotenera sp.]